MHHPAPSTPHPPLESWPSLPISSCDPSVGQLCLPNACEKNRCGLMPNAKCIANRCGCETRFFKWNNKTKVFHDYSRMCHVSNQLDLAELQFLVSIFKPGPQTSKEDSKDLVDLYRTFNSLTVEVLLDIARFLQDVVKSDPSEKNLAKLRGVHNVTARGVYREESLTEKRFPPNHWERHRHNHGHSSKVIIKKKFHDTEDKQNGTVEDELEKWKTGSKSEGNTEDRKFVDVLRKGWKIAEKFLDEDATTTDIQTADQHKAEERFLPLIGKVAKKLFGDEGKFSDEIKSGKLAISDKEVRDKLSLTAHQITFRAIFVRNKWTKNTANARQWARTAMDFDDLL